MSTYYYSYRLVYPCLSSATLLSPCIEDVDANSINLLCGFFLCISELSDGCSSLTMMKHSVNEITKTELFRNTEYSHLPRALIEMFQFLDETMLCNWSFSRQTFFWVALFKMFICVQTLK